MARAIQSVIELGLELWQWRRCVPRSDTAVRIATRWHVLTRARILPDVVQATCVTVEGTRPSSGHAHSYDPYTTINIRGSFQFFPRNIWPLRVQSGFAQLFPAHVILRGGKYSLRSV